MSSPVNTTQSKCNNRYLKITIHDNDFTNSLEQVAHTLNGIFSITGRYPEEDELPLLKKYIESLWFSIDNIWQIMRWNKNSVGFSENPEKIFKPVLEFVEYEDIPDWDDNSSVYIPMFNTNILVR
jgi:hypothetical protein